MNRVVGAVALAGVFLQFEEVGSRPSRMTTGRSQAFSVSHAGPASGLYGSDQWRAVSGGQSAAQKCAAAEEIASTIRRIEITRRAPARKSILMRKKLPKIALVF